jgi:HK97 family phage major capsid protein
MTPCQLSDHFKDFLHSGTVNWETKGLTSDAADGGVVMPASISEQLKSKVDELAPLRQLANSTTISSDSLDVVIERNAPDVGWVTEQGDRTETDPSQLEKRRIAVHESYAKIRLSQRLIDDACIPIEDWLMGRIAAQMAAIEHKAFIQGDGVHQPKGFLRYAGSGQSEWGRLQTFTTLQNGGFLDDATALEVLFKTLDSVKSEYLHKACWVMSRSAQSKLRQIKDPASGHVLWHTGTGLAGEVANTLLGYPVFVSDDMPTLDPSAPSLSVAFGNFERGYQIVDRQELSILRDPYTAKPYVEFYATRRVGGDVVDFDAIKLIHFSEE